VLTGPEFAALEARLSPAPSVGGRAYDDRHDVPGLLDAARALLAECRELRRPPDVAGLMPAAELAQVRAWVGEGPSSAPAALAGLLRHADALSALVCDLYGVIADLHADDPWRQALLERGRAEGRWQAADLAEAASARWVAALGTPHEPLREVAAEICALGPCRPPLPPCEAEAEAARLREALRGLLAAAGKANVGTTGPNTAAWFENLSAAWDAARAALGEEVR
jgi:hypothetical protein